MKLPKVCPGCNGKGNYRHYLDDEEITCDICEGDGKFHPEKFTCSRCSDKNTCYVAWDMYNTNGDCLGFK